MHIIPQVKHVQEGYINIRQLLLLSVDALWPQNLHRNGAAEQTDYTIFLTSAVETVSALILARVGGFVDVVVVEYEDDGSPQNCETEQA